jgi:hypothetical protein
MVMLPWLFLPGWLLPLLFVLILPSLLFGIFLRNFGKLKKKVTTGLTGLKANPFKANPIKVEFQYETSPKLPARRDFGPLLGLCMIMLPWLFLLWLPWPLVQLFLVVLSAVFLLRVFLWFYDLFQFFVFRINEAARKLENKSRPVRNC